MKKHISLSRKNQQTNIIPAKKKRRATQRGWLQKK
jgi:hypothetical protein